LIEPIHEEGVNNDSAKKKIKTPVSKARTNFLSELRSSALLCFALLCFADAKPS
jgi:hypothetical protein